MKTIYITNQEDIEQREDTVLVLGYFDGLHKGHQALFEAARKIATAQQLKIAVLTFPESPKIPFVRYQEDLLSHLANPDEREEAFAAIGVDFLYLIDFSSRFAHHTGQEFVEQYIKALKAKVIVAGFDYHFGRDKQSAKDLQGYTSAEVIIVPSVEKAGEKISSTRIKQAITKGDVKVAYELLGRPLTTHGLVVHGDARGRTLGYPTANLAPLDRVILPQEGVYVVDVAYQGHIYRGMASIGKNVTFNGNELRLEVHLFDFSGNMYGDKVTIYWLDRLRDMIKFSSLKNLMVQLKQDEAAARRWTLD
ncbi:bifunctional riboflavin kinase/FAD synthetase [Streptococcus himalayensis]|uniref:Riboflavin biosynthesis protein n=1 Tax=Streptococcus himalayensis TaxID=1888195 RepID=A0A917A5T8_9STRE|nr:bifunctional riboflavin kinase/FAD synthetase [Streptococcus himalayensis]GGE28104.1 riboflavin biosynthesis protein [Streptococcus himalayensis]